MPTKNLKLTRRVMTETFNFLIKKNLTSINNRIVFASFILMDLSSIPPKYAYVPTPKVPKTGDLQ